MDCPDACSLVVSSDGDRFRIEGNPEHSFTAGFTCAKIKKHIERLRHPDRIVSPMRRTGGRWQTLSWDAALDLCAEKIQALRADPTAILHIHGSGAKGVLKEATRLFFSRLGTSRIQGSLCDAAGIMGCIRDFGSRRNPELSDLMQAERIVNWGKDLSRSSIHTAAAVRMARRKGARVLAISPGGDGNGSFSDRSIRIRPGTDRFLAAAVIRRLIENGRIDSKTLEKTKKWERFRILILERSLEWLASSCDVRLPEIDTVCSWYSEAGSTATLIGAGLQRYRYGGETIRFINALSLLSGNIGRPGGGSYFHLNSYRNFNLDWIEDSKGKPRRSFNLPLIGREILSAKDPAIKMIWISGTNIVNQAAESKQVAAALDRTDFVVVVDAFATDTMDRADLFLPSTLMLEQEDVIGSYFHDDVQYLQPVFGGPGETKDDYTILSELGMRLDPPVRLPEKEWCLSAALDSPNVDIDLKGLKESKWVRSNRAGIPYAPTSGFDHSDGCYRFPLRLHAEPASPAGFPLRLLTLIRKEAIHSQILPEDQFGSPAEPAVEPPAGLSDGTPAVWIAPESPVRRQIDPKKPVYLVSPKGRMRVRLNLLSGLHPEAVLYRRGDWMKYGGGVNRIIEARLTDLGACAAFYDQYVRLENG
jgi:anaerobic selenocysteine-containing dehydrogenase